MAEEQPVAEIQQGALRQPEAVFRNDRGMIQVQGGERVGPGAHQTAVDDVDIARRIHLALRAEGQMDVFDGLGEIVFHRVERCLACFGFRFRRDRHTELRDANRGGKGNRLGAGIRSGAAQRHVFDFAAAPAREPQRAIRDRGQFDVEVRFHPASPNERQTIRGAPSAPACRMKRKGQLPASSSTLPSPVKYSPRTASGTSAKTCA